MSLGGLRDYEGDFRAKEFVDEKWLQCTACSPYKDYTTKQVKGTKVTVVILEDHSTYTPKSDGTVVSNIFEKLVIKVPKTITVPIGATVKVINPKARIWGEYRNNLSITADDVQVVTPSKS